MANVADGKKLVTIRYPITPNHIRISNPGALYVAISRAPALTDQFILMVRHCQLADNTWVGFSNSELAVFFPNLDKATKEALKDLVVKVRKEWYLTHRLITNMFMHCPVLDQSFGSESRTHFSRKF